MLCIADRHCSQRCIAMLEMLLCGLSRTACAEAVLCLNVCSKHMRQQNALHSRQALLSAVYCNARDAAVWPV